MGLDAQEIPIELQILRSAEPTSSVPRLRELIDAVEQAMPAANLTAALTVQAINFLCEASSVSKTRRRSLAGLPSRLSEPKRGRRLPKVHPLQRERNRWSEGTGNSDWRIRWITTQCASLQRRTLDPSSSPSASPSPRENSPRLRDLSRKANNCGLSPMNLRTVRHPVGLEILSLGPIVSGPAYFGILVRIL
jgi:hypothetical protein